MSAIWFLRGNLVSFLPGNVYGWFVRESRGILGLTESGRAAVALVEA